MLKKFSVCDILEVSENFFGGQMAVCCEKLSSDIISSALSIGGIRVNIFDEIDSTNSEARRQIEQGMTSPALIISDTQTGGRGRMGRSFYSPASTGLYMSMVFKATEKAVNIVRFTTAAAVAVVLSIEELCGISTEIKWVNDIYLDGRKICGILCESFLSCGERYAVIGIGINLHTRDFPPDIRDRATSLNPSGKIRNFLAARIADNLCAFWRDISSPQIMEYYREHSMVLGKNIVFSENGEIFCGIAEDIDDNGALHVRLDNGLRKILSSGEISLRLSDGKYL